MDVSEQRYRKVMGEYRSQYGNIINEYPIDRADTSRLRNLRYIATKAVLSSNYPYYQPIYEEVSEEIKNGLSDPQIQARVLAIRLARALPFLFRVRLIENCETQITNAILGQYKKEGVSVTHPYGYEVASDFSDFLLSVFELTCQSEDIYFDVNQRVITIFSRFFESVLGGDKGSLRNGCEVLRNIFWVLGLGSGSGSARSERVEENKLISKLLSTFLPSSSFVNRQDPSSDRLKNNTKLLTVILRCREFEARIRARQLYGFCCLLSYLPRMDYEILDILTKEVFQVLQNVSECDVTLECFGCLGVLVWQEQEYQSRNALLRRWVGVLGEVGFKKEYVEYYILLLEVVNRREFEVPHRLRYALAVHCIEVGRNVQQQYTRFVLYGKGCRAMVGVGRRGYRGADCNLLLNIFQYGWFIDRINQENDLFKSEFLIALLHAFAEEGGQAGRQEVVDLLDLCHRLIDWKCTSKEETHIPTLKLAFDMYLWFLGVACGGLGGGAEGTLVELVNRCNEPSIYFLFKFKLIAALLGLGWYQQNHRYLQGAKLQFHFLQDEVRPVMMPRNPKPIFTYDYSLTFDGEIESRKEIEYIKIIMDLLAHIQKTHEEHAQEVEAIIVDYHRYLAELELKEDCNRELVNCLQTLEADSYFNDSQRHFLLSTISNPPALRALNAETNLEDALLHSHCESVEGEQEVNVFGPMSPVQLTIKLHPHPSYSSVFIHIKKNQWVQTQSELKLIVSSALEKIELPFQSSILEIRVDRIGSLHFEVWKGTDNDILLGSGNYRVPRKLRWRRVDHLGIIDGIKTKAYFKECQPNTPPECYLSYYYGEPIMIQILKGQNQVIIGVSSKEIWNEIRDVVPNLIQDLANGSANIQN